MESNDLQSKPPRTSDEITAEILRLLRLGKTGNIEIYAYAHLTWDQGFKYTENLVKTGLIEAANEELGLPCFRITKKGLDALSVIESRSEKVPRNGGSEILHRSKISEVNTGEVLVSSGVADLAGKNRKFALYIQVTLERYRRGDWGDREDNINGLKIASIENNLRLFSAYESDIYPEVWITTEPDRRYTTVMFPEEDISLEPFERYWAERDTTEAK